MPKKSDYNKTIAVPPSFGSKEIITLREKMGLSQKALSFFLNVSVNTIKSWENDKTHPRGCVLRLLELLDKKPQIFIKSISSINIL